MKRFRRILATVLVLLMVVAMLPTTVLAEDTLDMDGKIVILHSNDVHGNVAGYAYMAAQKKAYEARGAEVILVDAGDYSQGTTYVSTSKGKAAIDMMNVVGYDVATLGNHEFDYGWAQLQENMAGAEFTVLCADVLDEEGDPIFDGHTVIEEDGVKIGFFGLETPEAQTKANPALIRGLTFLAGEDLYDCAQDEIDALETEGADVIICLSHLGLDNESKPNRSSDLLAEVEGVDMILDGHSHTVIEATEAQPIQSTGTAFEYIGVVVIDSETEEICDNYLYQVPGEVAPGDDTAPLKDPETAAAAQAIIDAINEEYGEVFARSEVALNGAKSPNGNRDSETNMGDLICDAMVWQVMQNSEGLAVPAENVVAITNGGGIRAPIGIGDVTKNDIHKVLPFGNTIALVYVTGSELLEALEASTYCTPEAVGGFPQVAGIEFTIDTTFEYDANDETYPGSTYYGPKSIQRVTIDSINGKPFKADATYAVITNNFCAAGGDTYYAFAAATSQFDTGVPLDEALMSYITEELDGVIGQEYAEPQGRIRVLTLKTADLYYDDLEAGMYYVEAVNVLSKFGLLSGTDIREFSPDEELTRGMLAAILYRFAGKPMVSELGSDTFTDVKKGMYYDKAIGWGKSVGVIYGRDSTTFAPDDPVTREELVTFLYRFATKVDTAWVLPQDGSPDASTAADWDYVSAYARKAVQWAMDGGVLYGTKSDPLTIDPAATATRAQAAAMIYRYGMNVVSPPMP